MDRAKDRKSVIVSGHQLVSVRPIGASASIKTPILTKGKAKSSHIRGKGNVSARM